MITIYKGELVHGKKMNIRVNALCTYVVNDGNECNLKNGRIWDLHQNFKSGFVQADFGQHTYNSFTSHFPIFKHVFVYPLNANVVLRLNIDEIPYHR